jgi:hypothetical protein
MENNMKNIAIVFAASLLASGCASSLKTFNAKSEPTVGIPIGTPVLVEITEETTYEVDPNHVMYESYCKPDTNSKYQFLALGERSFIAFDPAPVGKGEFKVEFNDAGVLKSVSLNSDATAGTEKITGLLETVLPYLAVPKPTPSAQGLPPDTSAQGNKEKYCIKKGTKVVSVKRVDIK